MKMPPAKRLLAACLLTALSALPGLRAADVNVLLIIADDFGIDVCPGYSQGTNKPSLPNITALKNSGVTFSNVWAQALCSPTRATMLTGRYGFRTGVQYVSLDSNSIGVKTNEPSIAKGLSSQKNIPSGAFGKWHIAQLGGSPATPAADHPIVMGFSKYAGNLKSTLPSYSNWQKVVNQTNKVETTTTSTTYATTDVVNEALGWINGQAGNWFAWVAFNAPHDPFHKPPNNLHSYDGLATSGEPSRKYYEAMCEAMDTEIGRLLNGIPAAVKAKTMVIFIGDNGTPAGVKLGGLRGAKFDVYEGGIRVPLIVSGANVVSTNRTSNALVNSTDIFATVMDVHGIALSTVNGGKTQDTKSFLPYVKNTTPANPRTTIFSDILSINGATTSSALKNNRYKLIRRKTGTSTAEEFYDLQADAQEQTNLKTGSGPTGTALTNYNTLKTAMDNLLQ